MHTTTYKRIQPGDFLTVAEVAGRLQVVPATVYRKVERGELEAVRIGCGPRPHLRIPRGSLTSLFAQSGSVKA